MIQNEGQDFKKQLVCAKGWYKVTVLQVTKGGHRSLEARLEEVK